VKRQEFLEENTGSWSRLEAILHELSSRRRRVTGLGLSERLPDPAEFDVLYRLVCRHLALVRQRDYGDDLAERLNDLALRAYRHLYSARRGFGATVAGLLLARIPATIRGRWVAVVIAASAFVLPLATFTYAVIEDPSLARAVLSAQNLRQYDEMYDPASAHFARERPSDSDLAMFGFYIWNNVGLAFQTFAWGLFAGVGSLFILVGNGLMIGATTGHLVRAGLSETFLPFIAGHSAFELTGIVLAGAAGLDLGWALLAPGRHSRLEAVQRAARSGAEILGGAFALLVLAAFVEAYWSSSTHVQAAWKYAVAALLWASVLFWIVRIPRRGP